MRFPPAVLLGSMVWCYALGQNYTIQTVAGRGWDMPGLSATLSSVSGAAVDSKGNVYMSLREYAVVVRMDSSGLLTLIAGNGAPGYSGDNGPAILAQLQSPTALAVDPAGTVYVADGGNVRRVSNGMITTVPGATIPSFIPAIGIPATGIAVDSAGNLYVAVNGRILKVSSGIATTVAGACCGTSPFGDNIPAVGAALSPLGVAVDAVGDLYIADTCYNRIRKVSNGVITTVAGNGTANAFSCAPPVAGGPDGRATAVSLDTVNGVAVDSSGDVYFTEGHQHSSGNSLAGGRVRKVSNGNITTVAGGGLCANPFTCAALSDNMPATSALLNNPNSVAIDTAGSVYIPDAYGLAEAQGFSIFNELGRLRKVSNGAITTVAGAQGVSGDGGPATGAQLNLPAGIAVDAAGSLYIADSAGNVVRKVSNGAITTVAGNRTYSLYRPRGVASDPARGIYVTDGATIVEVLNGNAGVLLSASQLNANIANIALDVAGNLYLADTTGNRILEVSNAGITTVAGDGTFGFAGDNGPAINAQLAGPSGVTLDSAGSLYITDLGNQRIRKITNGTITTVAGNGMAGFSGDNGPATSAQLNLPPLGCSGNRCDAQLPAGVAVDAAGNLYIADSGNHRVRKISNGAITTLAGNGTPGFSGDTGPASQAQLDIPSGIAVDAAGNVYVADSANNRIRVLIPQSPPPPGLAPAISLVANAFGESPMIAANTWVEIKGSNLAPAGDARIWQESDFVNNQLPAALDGVSVRMNGKNAYVYYISASQINVLTPPDLNPGPVQVNVTVAGVTSAVFTSQAQLQSPSLFVYSGSPYVVAVHADSSRIGPSSLYPGLTTPARPGETILLFANGFGPTLLPVAGGSVMQIGSLPALPLVSIGGASAMVQSAGLISPGLYQLNVVVPASAADGDSAIVATYNGAGTQAGTLLAIQH